MGKERWKQTALQLKAALLQDKKKLALLLGAAALLGALLLTSGEKAAKQPPQTDEVQTDLLLKQQELCALLGAIRGVGQVRLMLSFESDGETVYARNTDSAQDDSDSRKEKSSVVIVKNGQNETGLVLRRKTPKVSGAAVVCEGGGDPVVRAFVVETLSALLGIKSNHISVMPM